MGWPRREKGRGVEWKGGKGEGGKVHSHRPLQSFFPFYGCIRVHEKALLLTFITLSRKAETSGSRDM